MSRSEIKRRNVLQGKPMFDGISNASEQEEWILSRVQLRMGWDLEKAKRWLQTDNPQFGGVSPAALLALGRGHKVVEFIKAVESGDAP